MPFVIDEDDAVEMTVRGSYDGQEIANVFWFTATPLPGGTTFPVADGSTRVLDAFQTLWQDQILPLLSLGYLVNQYVLRKLIQPFPGGTPKWNFSSVDARLGTSPLDAGSASGESMPTYASVNVWYQATPSGRSGRGRKSFGPLPETASDSGTGLGNYLTDAALAQWETATDPFDEMIFTGITDPHFRLVPIVASLKEYVALSGESLYLRPITGSIVRQALGSQVSRKRKNSFA